MSITINGTTGIAGVDGSAATPSVQGADANTGMFFPAADTVAVTTGGSERLRVDSSGNVGIGTSSPSEKLSVNGNMIMPAATTESRSIEIGGGRTGNGYAYIDFVGDATYTDFGLRIIRENNGANTNSTIAHRGTGALVLKTEEAAVITFSTTATERMRIDSTGDVAIGTATIAGRLTVSWNSGAQQGLVLRTTAATFAGSPVVFQTSAGTTAGFISQTATPSVAYNTTSDYRLKENVQPMVGALDKIAQLNPVTYNWKSDGSDGQGFIAHELQAVVPDCVSGEKDAVDADGNPQHQGVDTSFLVATLVAAIQELTARIAALEAK
jgi:hypothetical protein